MLVTLSALDRCLENPDNNGYWQMAAQTHRKYVPRAHTLPWQKLKTPWPRLALWLCFFDSRGTPALLSLIGSQHFGPRGNAVLEAILATTPPGETAQYKQVIDYLNRQYPDMKLAYDVVTLMDNRDSFAITVEAAAAQVGYAVQQEIGKNR